MSTNRLPLSELSDLLRLGSSVDGVIQISVDWIWRFIGFRSLGLYLRHPDGKNGYRLMFWSNEDIAPQVFSDFFDEYALTLAGGEVAFRSSQDLALLKYDSVRIWMKGKVLLCSRLNFMGNALGFLFIVKREEDDTVPFPRERLILIKAAMPYFATALALSLLSQPTKNDSVEPNDPNYWWKRGDPPPY